MEKEDGENGISWSAIFMAPFKVPYFSLHSIMMRNDESEEEISSFSSESE